MYLSLFVIYVLLSAACATPILVSECGILETPFSTYKLAQDVVVRNTTYGFICLDIRGDGITLDGNGFELSADKLLRATGVQYSGTSTVVMNMRISNMRTGIYAKGKFGQVFNNTITRAINGIDVTATNNKILYNTISQFEAYESTAGIYVYFPAIAPVDSFINITNNVISDIQGDSFALGIAVYYATAVYVAHNSIFNLRGGISSEQISVIHGRIDSVDNSFVAPAPEGPYGQVITVLASLFALVASFVFFYSSSLSLSSSTPSTPKNLSDIKESEREDESEKESEEKEKEREEKEKEREEFELDGADIVRPTMSISLGSSPSVR